MVKTVVLVGHPSLPFCSRHNWTYADSVTTYKTSWLGNGGIWTGDIMSRTVFKITWISFYGLIYCGEQWAILIQSLKHWLLHSIGAIGRINRGRLKEKPSFHTSKGTTCISMAKLVRWLHKHTEYVMFPPERTQPSLDQTPSFELKKKKKTVWSYSWGK